MTTTDPTVIEAAGSATGAVQEIAFRAMGSDAHVILVGAPAELTSWAQQRIEQLEAMWSRFLPTSEISVLNAEAGRWVEVSEETARLVSTAVAAWRLTGGTCDATVLGDVIRAGYDRSFDELGPRQSGGSSSLVIGCTDIEIDGSSVRLPAGVGFDPGGIGKGLAADLVCAELMAAGAAGACVNLGGDVRVSGAAPDGDGDGWTIAVDHAQVELPFARVGILDGAVATSTSLLRRWLVGGSLRHHLIDPSTGLPTDSDLAHVTVLAHDAWAAEALAKAILIRGSLHPFDLLGGTGAEAIIVGTDGWVTSTPGIGAYLGGGSLPVAIRDHSTNGRPWT